MDKTTSRQAYSGFWPLVLVCVSLVVLLGWNLFAAVQQHGGGVRLRTQQQTQQFQAVEVESKLRLMMSDLIELGKEDPAAAGVLKKYNITMTPPVAADQGGGPSVE